MEVSKVEKAIDTSVLLASRGNIDLVFKEAFMILDLEKETDEFIEDEKLTNVETL